MNIETIETGTRVADYSRTDWGYTYFVRCGGVIKIGHSGDPKSRISQIQVGFPGTLEVLAIVPHTVVNEPTAHKKFSCLRLSGEWFTAAPDLLEFIAQVRSEADALPKRVYPTNSEVERSKDIQRLKNRLASIRNIHPAAELITTLIRMLNNYSSAEGERRKRLAMRMEETMRKIESGKHNRPRKYRAMH